MKKQQRRERCPLHLKYPLCPAYLPRTVRMNPVATHISCPMTHPFCMEATMSTGIPYRQTSSSVSTRFSKSRW